MHCVTELLVAHANIFQHVPCQHVCVEMNFVSFVSVQFFQTHVRPTQRTCDLKGLRVEGDASHERWPSLLVVCKHPNHTFDIAHSRKKTCTQRPMPCLFVAISQRSIAVDTRSFC